MHSIDATHKRIINPAIHPGGPTTRELIDILRKAGPAKHPRPLPPPIVTPINARDLDEMIKKK